MKKKTARISSRAAFKNFDLLSAAFEQTADHVVITDYEGVIIYVNPAFEKTTGFTAEETLGKTPRILKSGKHDRLYYKKMWETIKAGRVFQDTLINQKKNGELYYADQTITPILDDHGNPTHFVSIWKDVTQRVLARQEMERLHEELKLEKNKLEKILNFGETIGTIENYHKLIDFIVEQAASILESERCSLMLLDPEKGELCIKGAIGLPEHVIKSSKCTLGEGIAGLVAQEDKPMLVEVIDTDDRISRGRHQHYRTQSFLSVPIELDRKLIGVLNVTDKISRDNTIYSELDLKILLTIVRQVAVALENAQLSKELKYLTILDPLTTLYNHRYLMECLNYEIKRFKRFKRNLCLLLIDVDNFRDYNDKFGRREGDMLLKKTGVIIKKSLREVDIICRYSADTFAAVLPETNKTEAERLGRMIMRAVKRAKFNEPVSLSMGIAKCIEDMNRHDLISTASAALHKAKENGKDNIYYEHQKK